VFLIVYNSIYVVQYTFWKNDVISSVRKRYCALVYIYTNTTKLVLHLSYLVRIDCFSNNFIDELLFKNNYFGRKLQKMCNFY